MTGADLERLRKILSLFDSSREGERHAALDAATRILAKHGHKWTDLLDGAEPPKREPQRGIWRKTCAELRLRESALRPWEVGFVVDLPKFRRISSKQRYILNEIAKRVLGGQASA